MGFSKDLFFQVREVEDAYERSMSRFLDNGGSNHSHQKTATKVEYCHYSSTESTRKEIFEIGYPMDNFTKTWVCIATEYTEKEADKTFRKIYSSRAEFRTGNKVLHLKRCYVNA